MRSTVDFSLARFLMIVSMILLAVLEYLWLHKEYQNKYEDVQEKLDHVMLTHLRDVEDSLIFTRLTDGSLPFNRGDESLRVNILVDHKGAEIWSRACPDDTAVTRMEFKSKPRYPLRGAFLANLNADSLHSDSHNLGTMVMHRIRMADSTGEASSYEIISWQGGDTMLSGLFSRPMTDVLAGKKMALNYKNYRADIFHDLLPHISFAVFLWLMVGAAFYYIWKNLRKQIRLNALRDEFVSNITHELKTPITTVGVALESLHMSEDVQSAQSRRYLDICQSELRRLSLLVERILHNRAPQIHYEKLDMLRLLDEVMQQMKVQFDNRQAIVSVSHEGEGFEINGDKAHMSGVLFNLLENALKYSDDHPEIRIRLSRNNGTIRMAVEDKGIGIESGYHDKIFEKLYRVPRQNRHDVKGHGLGLSYVADVVKKHEGQIDVVSAPGKGSTFSITLPAWHEN